MQSNNTKINEKILNEESKVLVMLIKDIIKQIYLDTGEYISFSYQARNDNEILIQYKGQILSQLNNTPFYKKFYWSKDKKNLYTCISECDTNNPGEATIRLKSLFPTIVEKNTFKNIVECGYTQGVVQYLQDHPDDEAIVTLELLSYASSQGYTQIVLAMIGHCSSMNPIQLDAQPLKAKSALIENFMIAKPGERLHFLLDTVRQLIANDAKSEIKPILKELNTQIKEKIFESCIGKVSYEAAIGKVDQSDELSARYHHSRQFGRGFTELFLLSKAIFTIREDGRMSIANIQEMTIYKVHYARRKNEVPSLRDELMYLGQMIGLEFAEDSDFVNEIIFTPSSTRKLVDLGVHYHEDYIRNLLYTQNKFRFFVCSAKADESTPGENKLKKLPLECVADKIFRFTVSDNLPLPSQLMDPSDMDLIISGNGFGK